MTSVCANLAVTPHCDTQPGQQAALPGVPTQGRGSGAAGRTLPLPLSPFPSPQLPAHISFFPLQAGFCIYHHSPSLQQEGKSPQPLPPSWFPFKGVTGNHFLSHFLPLQHMEQVKLFQEGEMGFCLETWGVSTGTGWDLAPLPGTVPAPGWHRQDGRTRS